MASEQPRDKALDKEQPNHPERKRPRGPYFKYHDPHGSSDDPASKIPKSTRWSRLNQSKKEQNELETDHSGRAVHSEDEDFTGEIDCSVRQGSRQSSDSDSVSQGSDQGSDQSLAEPSDNEEDRCAGDEDESYSSLPESDIGTRQNILPACILDGISPERGGETEILSDDDITDQDEDDQLSDHSEDNTDTPDEIFRSVIDNNAANPDEMLNDNIEANVDSPDNMLNVSIEDNANTPDISSFRFLKEILQKEAFCKPIKEKVVSSSGEVLLMALAVAKHFSMPVQGLLAILKLVNTMFAKPVIPDTRYKLDKLLCVNAICYHFYCKNCTQSLGGKPVENMDQTQIICPNCTIPNSVSNLCNATYFVTIDMSEQLNLLLQNEKNKLVKPADAIANYDGTIRDIYDGEMYRKFALSLPEDPTCQYASFSFCTDGTPLYKSSKTSLWPITVMVNELGPTVRTKNIILAGLWCGPSKPPMDVFLEPFVEDMRRYGDVGLKTSLDGKLIIVKFRAIACCVDSVARCPLQGISQHNGECPCNWCLHPGERQDDGSRKFPLLKDGLPPPRTPEGMLADTAELAERRLRGERVNGQLTSHVNGVRNITPLWTLPSFDIVKGMVVDPMHSCWLGVARHIAKYWFAFEGGDCYVGSPNNLRVIDKRLIKLTCPVEARRLPRSVRDMNFWKAKEWGNWTLFYSIPVLSGILADKYIVNWAYFVEASHILLCTNISPDDILLAKQLIIRFVAAVETLYGVSHMTFNIKVYDVSCT